MCPILKEIVVMFPSSIPDLDNPANGGPATEYMASGLPVNRCQLGTFPNLFRPQSQRVCACYPARLQCVVITQGGIFLILSRFWRLGHRGYRGAPPQHLSVQRNPIWCAFHSVVLLQMFPLFSRINAVKGKCVYCTLRPDAVSLGLSGSADNGSFVHSYSMHYLIVKYISAVFCFRIYILRCYREFLCP